MATEASATVGATGCAGAGVIQAREPLCKKGPESGQTRANKSNVCFDDGEGGYGGVVEGRVCRLDYYEERAEAHDGDHADTAC